LKWRQALWRLPLFCPSWGALVGGDAGRRRRL